MLTHRRSARVPLRDAGFTLIELVMAVAIMGIVVVALTGIVIEYVKTATSTAARYTESTAVQLAAAYWQRDVASVGIRTSTYTSATHSFALQSSIDYPYSTALIGAGCTVPGTGVVTLAWGQYDSISSDTPTTIAVTYSVQAAGAGPTARYNLVRTRCSNTGGSWTTTSSVVITQNLTTTSLPTVTCSSSCTSATVPATVSLTVVSIDPNNRDGTTYTATLTGERRQT